MRKIVSIAAVLVFASVFASGCSVICKIQPSACQPPVDPPDPPDPEPGLPVPPESQQCHLVGAVSSCFDNPPTGESFEQWEPNWGWVCDDFTRVALEADCPVVEPPDPPDPPDPGPTCGFPQGVPDEDFTQHPNLPGTYGSVVNSVMADLSGCSVGGDCPITFGPDPWMKLVCDKLCEQGFNCGRHRNTTPGGTDQISVTRGSFRDGPHQNYQIYNYGGGKVRWAPGGYQGGWSISSTAPPDPPDPPNPGVCTNPDPRGRPASFALHCGLGNGTVCDSTFRVDQREYCDQVCSPSEPNVCFTGRLHCPMRMEGDPERAVCEDAVIGNQQWWCDGQKIEPFEDNSARARCVGRVKTCTEDGSVCSEKDTP